MRTTKKLLLIASFIMMGCVTKAQSIAVLDFNAGAGVSKADVDGVAAIFNTYFSPNGYTLVERTRIDRVIDEQGFQRGKFTQEEMVRIGEILNVSMVVIGDVNYVMREYNVDVRVVSVETGLIVAKEGITWTVGSSYREMMKKLAERLANQIAINPVSVESYKEIPIYRKKGALLRFEAPSPLAFGIGYQFTSTFMTGIGCGWYLIPGGSEGPMGIYSEFRFSTPRYKWSLFVDGRIGLNVHANMFAAGSIGVMYKNLSIGVGYASESITGSYGGDFGLSLYISYDLKLGEIKLKELF